MTKRSLAISLALLVSLMPYLGFPVYINDIYFTGAGIIIAALIHLSSIHYCNACQSKIEHGKKEMEENKIDDSEEITGVEEIEDEEKAEKLEDFRAE